MPRLKPVPTLLDTCLQKLSNFYMKFLVRRCLLFQDVQTEDEELQAEVNSSRRLVLKQLNRHLKNEMIASLRSQLLKIALPMILDLKFDEMEVILGLNSSAFGFPHPKNMWDIAQDILIFYGGEGIQELDLSAWKIAHTDKINPLKTQSPKIVLAETLFSDKMWADNIKELKFPSLWYVEILESIASNCPNLQHLDISSDFSYDMVQQFVRSPVNVDLLGCLYGFQSTSDGLIRKENMGCQKLRSLTFPKFGGHSLVIDHCVQMMQFMPDLHCIRNVDTRLVAVRYMKVFGHQQCMKLTDCEEWKRSRYQEDEHNSLSENLGKFFPAVKRCALYCVESGPIPICYEWVWLKTRANFLVLEELEIHYPQMLEELTSVDPMPSVKVFKLYEIEHMDIEGMKIINSMFPNLEVLTLFADLYLCDDDDSKPDIMFLKLRILELNRIIELDANFVKVVLEKSPALKILELFCIYKKRLMLGEVDAISDELVNTLGHSMNNLERIIFGVDSYGVPGKIKLGYFTMKYILTFCPHLRCIGDLADWNVSKNRMTKIIDNITTNNWDLEIVYSDKESC